MTRLLTNSVNPAILLSLLWSAQQPKPVAPTTQPPTTVPVTQGRCSLERRLSLIWTVLSFLFLFVTTISRFLVPTFPAAWNMELIHKNNCALKIPLGWRNLSMNSTDIVTHAHSTLSFTFAVRLKAIVTIGRSSQPHNSSWSLLSALAWPLELTGAGAHRTGEQTAPLQQWLVQAQLDGLPYSGIVVLETPTAWVQVESTTSVLVRQLFCGHSLLTLID